MSATDIITAAGASLTAAGLVYTAIQVRRAQRTARSQFLLQLYQMMEQHNDLHLKLTGLGWPDGRTGPESAKEWMQVGRALGLFEYIQILVRDRIIDIDTVDQLYSYRLFHLVNNETIKERHFGSQGRWDGVVQLWKALEGKKNFQLTRKLASEGNIPVD